MVAVDVWDARGIHYGRFDATQFDFTQLMKMHNNIFKGMGAFEYSSWIVPFTDQLGAFTMSELLESEAQSWAPLPPPQANAVGFIHSHPGEVLFPEHVKWDNKRIYRIGYSSQDLKTEKALKLPFFALGLEDGILIRCLNPVGNLVAELVVR